MNILFNYYKKQLHQVYKEQEIIFEDVLGSCDKKFIINFIDDIDPVNDRLNKNLQFLKLGKINDTKKLENIIKYDFREYWICLINAQLELLHRLAVDILTTSAEYDAKREREFINEMLINNNKQR